MPWTLNMLHSSHFNAFFPVKINKMWNFCLKFWFFRNSLIIETQNLCNWIQHALNPKICPTQAILMLFSQSKSTKCEIFAWTCIFLPLMLETQNAYLGCLKLWICTTQTISMMVFPVKINKMWNFWFFRNHLL